MSTKMLSECSPCLGQLPIPFGDIVVNVDQLLDQTSVEDYIQYTCNKSAGRDVSPNYKN